MEILKTISFESEGNDCWIKKSFTLITDLGKKYLIHHKNVSGWSSYDEFRPIEINNDFNFKEFFEKALDSDEYCRIKRDWDLEDGVEDLEGEDEKETDHILIENGEVFDGTRKEFKNEKYNPEPEDFQFFTNEEIKNWCFNKDFTLRINGKKMF